MCIDAWAVAWLVILLCCKSNKSFPIDINSQWIIASNDNINSQIELVAIDEKRVVDVSADDNRFILWHIFKFVKNKYAFTLARTLWFHDPHVALDCFLEAFVAVMTPLTLLILLVLEILRKFIKLFW